MTSADWRVVVADDEPAARRGVRQLLAAFPEFVVVQECRDGAETMRALQAERPHVLFLDIQMPEADGFEVLARHRPGSLPLVILLTAYDQFAVRGFDAEALDYLVKPVSEARFRVAIERVRRRLATRSVFERESVIVVTEGETRTVLPVREIDWIEAAGNYARVWTGGRGFLLRESLNDLEQRVEGFVRAHRSALVRLAGIRSLRVGRAGGLVAVLGCGTTVPISRRRRSALERSFEDRA